MITYINDDLFANIPTDTEILIPHIVNNADQMGSGFVVPLFTKWPVTKELYHKNKKLQILGENQWIDVEKNIGVVHMCAQDNLTKNMKKRCRYGHLAACMKDISNLIYPTEKIYAPKFGSGIGGGDWNIIEELIEDIWSELDVNIFYLD